ncbi:hypothetical protein AURDEDRAFT_158028 [Auricularia subglabra TFB-10046 SS5]|nr:hypothetical protein AURDEDRAFT_158028 [Auricularia subglabra TFB-10046 SS5]
MQARLDHSAQDLVEAREELDLARYELREAVELPVARSKPARASAHQGALEAAKGDALLAAGMKPDVADMAGLGFTMHRRLKTLHELVDSTAVEVDKVRDELDGALAELSAAEKAHDLLQAGQSRYAAWLAFPGVARTVARTHKPLKMLDLADARKELDLACYEPRGAVELAAVDVVLQAVDVVLQAVDGEAPSLALQPGHALLAAGNVDTADLSALTLYVALMKH